MPRFVTRFVVGLMPFLGAPAPAQSPEPIQVDIVAQPVGDALNQFAEQSGLQVVLYADDAEGINVAPVAGQFDDATMVLDSLLAGTGLEYSFINERTVAVAPVQKVAEKGGNSEAGNGRTAGARPALMTRARTSAQQSRTSRRPETDSDKLEEIIVTGTNIRGMIPESSPLFVFDAAEIKASGALTTEQFVRSLPQNINTLTSSGVLARAGGGTGENGVDLRGLGIGTTLVLMNGRRLAPSSGGRTPDLSLIPLGLVERVEILTDGASAIYGSDAIGGVVNFILRDDLDGAETSLGYGTVTDGGHDQLRIQQSLGADWSGGRGLVAYNFLDQSDLDASDRDFATVSPPYTLIPDDQRHNVLVTIEQELPSQFRLAGDFLVTSRDLKTSLNRTAGSPDELQFRDSEQDLFFAGVEVSRKLTDTLRFGTSISYSEFEEIINFSGFPQGGEPRSITTEERSRVFEVVADLSGSLVELPGGSIRYSLGGSYTRDEVSGRRIATTTTGSKLDRNTKAVFAELMVPLVQARQSVPWISRLELSIANRYTEYSDFGGENSPKLGLLWSPTESLNLRSTYAQSFRAPFLNQLSTAAGAIAIYRPAQLGLPDIFSSDGSTVVFQVNGRGNPDLGPETADSFTLGFDYSPAFADGLTIAVTYYEIDYDDRIASGDPTNGFASLRSPEDFLDIYLVDPSAELIDSLIVNDSDVFFDSVGVQVSDREAVAEVVDVVLDLRLKNLALSKVSGVDFTVDYTWEANIGSFSTGANAAYVLDSVRKTTPNAPEITVVDSIFNPASLKGTAYFGFSSGGFNSRVTIDYVDDYDNPSSSTEPTVSSWLTTNLTGSYTFDSPRGFLNGARLSFVVRNLFDEDPPSIGLGDVVNVGLNEPIGYDPTNASPIGRFVSLELYKKW